MMSVTRVAKTLRGGNEFFIACRKPAPDVSRLGRDLARILLCDATAVVVMFSSLVASRNRRQGLTIGRAW